MAEDQGQDGAANDDSSGFDGYVETTNDPGPWLLMGTTAFCFGSMLLVVPLMVSFALRRRIKRNQQKDESLQQELMQGTKPPVETTFASVLRFDKETKKILKLAIPYTITSFTSSTISNVALALIGRKIGTKEMGAYALVQVLVGLTDDFLQGPLYATTALAAQSVGAGNTFLAGQYIQIAIVIYLLLNIPGVWFWWNYMYDIILYLEWGDEETATLAQDFIYIYIWSYIFGALSSGVWQLLEVADHAQTGAIISFLWSLVNVAVVWVVVTRKQPATLADIGWAYVATSIFFIGFTFVLAEARGWLKPFRKGLYGSFGLRNVKAVGSILNQGLPLAFGSLLSNAEWAILTFFASVLGPAEVVAWSILGSIWDVFYSVTGGIGDAAEIRVAYHLGDNHPTMAKLVAHKALLQGMVVALVVSLIYFSLQDQIPGWFTVDETLQGMLRELVPFVGVANLTMTFGMQCWSLIGAQGKYKQATWISFFSSWGVTMPLAAISTYIFRIDLQGLTAAVTVGYVSTGACLSYVLLSTNWYKVAKKVQDVNNDTSNGEMNKDEEAVENSMYASMRPNSHAARAAARRNIRLMTIPAGLRSGIVVGNLYGRPGMRVLMVRNWSPLFGRVNAGDSILALNGNSVSGNTAQDLSTSLKQARWQDRDIAIVSAQEAGGGDDNDDDNEELLIEGIAEDESSEAPTPQVRYYD